MGAIPLGPDYMGDGPHDNDAGGADSNGNTQRGTALGYQDGRLFRCRGRGCQRPDHSVAARGPPRWQRNELEGMLHDAAGRLSPAHVAALVAHPEAVCSALAAADALTASDRERSGVKTIAGAALAAVDAAEADGRLAARTGEAVSESLLTSEELVARTRRHRVRSARVSSEPCRLPAAGRLEPQAGSSTLSSGDRFNLSSM